MLNPKVSKQFLLGLNNLEKKNQVAIFFLIIAIKIQLILFSVALMRKCGETVNLFLKNTPKIGTHKCSQHLCSCSLKFFLINLAWPSEDFLPLDKWCRSKHHSAVADRMHLTYLDSRLELWTCNQCEFCSVSQAIRGIPIHLQWYVRKASRTARTWQTFTVVYAKQKKQLCNVSAIYCKCSIYFSSHAMWSSNVRSRRKTSMIIHYSDELYRKIFVFLSAFAFCPAVLKLAKCDARQQQRIHAKFPYVIRLGVEKQLSEKNVHLIIPWTIC